MEAKTIIVLKSGYEINTPGHGAKEIANLMRTGNDALTIGDSFIRYAEIAAVLEIGGEKSVSTKLM